MIRAIATLYQRIKAPLPAVFFSPDWYLSQYPDVAVSGMDPWLHFHHHGRHEGRFACAQHLALFFDHYSLEDLEESQQRECSKLTAADQCYLDWLVARYYAHKSNWQAVLNTLRVSDLIKNASPVSHLPRLLYCDALCRAGEPVDIQSQLQEIIRCDLEYADMHLMSANLAQRCGDSMAWLQAINSIYETSSCRPVTLVDAVLSIDALDCPVVASQDGPLVSVLMAARNAAAGLDTALSSILNQTHRNLEVIVVDDASTDGTAAIVSQWAKLDLRVRLLQLNNNSGTYVARNWAMEHARGEFITVHDSDDWSHPQKLSMQVRALMDNANIKATLSAWARVSDGLYFGGWDTPEAWQGWVHRNISSLMIRRSVFEELGYWDEVRCSADTEYMYRIQAKWGLGSIKVVAPHLPLAFGRVRAQALTRTPETHLLTVLKGLRHDYQRAYSAWHASASSQGSLYMARSPMTRPFEIADTMRVKNCSG